MSKINGQLVKSVCIFNTTIPNQSYISVHMGNGSFVCYISMSELVKMFQHFDFKARIKKGCMYLINPKLMLELGGKNE